MTRVVSPVFVGRRAELDRLAAMAKDAGQGRPSLVLLAGEAGIGKSRLVDEFASRTRLIGTRVAVGTCVNSANIDQQHAALRGALRDLTTQPDPEAGDLPPELDWLADGSKPTTGPTLGRRFESLLQFLARLAARAPLVLVFEDLHWAETSTLDLVTFLAQQMRQCRLAVLGTYRDDDLHRGHLLRPVLAELKRARVECVKLGGLSHAEIRLLLESLSPTMPTGTVVDTMLARTQGNPFYVEELLAAEREGDTGLPQSLRDMLLTRVDALSPPCQELLRVMAVVGSPVRHDLLVDLAEPPGVDLDATLGPSLDAGTIVAVPPDCYRFRHALTEEALAAELLPGHRVRLHREIAEALETQPQLAGSGRASAVGETARHWVGAGEPARALAPSVIAGRTATELNFPAEATAHYTRALTLWPDVADARSLAGIDHADLLSAAAQAAQLGGDLHRALDWTRSAMDEIDGDGDRVRQALIRERLGRITWLNGNGERSLELYEQAADSSTLSRRRRPRPRYWRPTPRVSCCWTATPTPFAVAMRRSSSPELRLMSPPKARRRTHSAARCGIRAAWTTASQLCSARSLSPKRRATAMACSERPTTCAGHSSNSVDRPKRSTWRAEPSIPQHKPDGPRRQGGISNSTWWKP